MAKWDHLIEADNAITRARRAWTSTSNYPNLIELNRVLKRFGEEAEWPDETLSLVASEVLQLLRAKSRTPLGWHVGMYKKHWVEVYVPVRPVAHYRGTYDMAIRVFFGPPKRPADFDLPADTPENRNAGVSPLRFSSPGQLDAQLGDVHISFNHDEHSIRDGNVGVMSVTMTAQWGWHRKDRPNDGFSRQCSQYRRNLIHWDSMEGLLNEAIKCGEKFIPGARR